MNGTGHRAACGLPRWGRDAATLLAVLAVLAAVLGHARAQSPWDLIERARRAVRTAERHAASKPTAKPKPDKPADKKPPAKKPPARKYTAATAKQIEANRKLAMTWYAKTRATVVASMHFIETDHFLIFSAWSRGNDKALRDICEKMYRAMCKQFDIPPAENIWAGKCPIYIFWETRHYEQFTTKVDERRMSAAAGYTAQRGAFAYIVMNRCETRTRFYEVLVHEATHAFLARYRTNRTVPRWLNEGLAEYMAAELVPGCSAEEKYLSATRTAVRENRNVSSVFKTVEMNNFDYGIVQSIVRFLIARDRKAFIKLIRLIKDGKPEAAALHEAYKLTHAAMLTEWRAAAAKGLGKTPTSKPVPPARK